MTVEEAETEVQQIEDQFPMLEDSPKVHEQWRRLVTQHRVTGVHVHDCRLVAVMLAHGLSNILTFDSEYVERYPGINAVNPADVSSSTSP